MAKAKTFSVNTTKNPDTLVSEAKQVAQENMLLSREILTRGASPETESKVTTR